MTPHCICQDTIDVRVEDEYGEYRQTVPVTITYAVEVDSDYGADADGRRGVRREEVFVLDTDIPLADLKTLNFYEIEYVAACALDVITKGDPHVLRTPGRVAPVPRRSDGHHQS